MRQVGRSQELSLWRYRTRGIALVAVLWVVSLLAVIAASFATTVRSETVVARNQIQNAEARALADAGFYRTVMALALERAGMSLSGLPEAWSFSGGEVTTSVQAESGKVDLNAADAALLAGLFAAAGAIDSGALAAAVVDFRDPDSDPQPRGAEDPDYRAAGLTFGAKDRPFERKDELLQVLGVTRAVYDAVAPAVTVYSRSKSIDPEIASAEVLEALQAVGLVEPNGARDSSSLGANAVPIFTIRAKAETEGGAVFVREAIVALTRGGRQPFRILTWEQGKL